LKLLEINQEDIVNTDKVEQAVLVDPVVEIKIQMISKVHLELHFTKKENKSKIKIES